MKHQWVIACLLGIFMGASLVGCAHNTAGVSINSAGDVLVDNTSLGRELTLTNPNSRIIGGLLNASVQLTNEETSDIYLQYRFVWFDANGIELESDASAWIPLQLHGKARQQVQGVAPNSRAVSFRLTVRPVYSQ